MATTVSTKATAKTNAVTKKTTRTRSCFLPKITTSTTPSYASSVNATRSSGASQSMTLSERWTTSFNSLPASTQKLVTHMLTQAIAEFKRRNPHINKWTDMNLVKACEETLPNIMIDASMQRQLDIFWIISLLTRFSATKIMPIQVYETLDGEIHAWDGQHTLFLLYIIATEICGEDPDSLKVPVNVYASHLKSEMRENFLDLNSSVGKKQIELIDHLLQQVYGVRIDGSKNPQWLLTEKKQSYAEANDLFFTAKKFGNAHMPGAISRVVEIMQYGPDVIENLCMYLALSLGSNRAADEKELVMMAGYFEKCRVANITVDAGYIADIYQITSKWNCNFDPTGPFWDRADRAYKNWHSAMGFGTHARFDKNPSLGMPFLIAQFKKDMTRPVPESTSNSNFVPADADLF